MRTLTEYEREVLGWLITAAVMDLSVPLTDLNLKPEFKAAIRRIFRKVVRVAPIKVQA